MSGIDADDLEIRDRGVLSFKEPPDYEEPSDFGRDNVYEVTVEAWDETGEIGKFEATVLVTNLTD